MSLPSYQSAEVTGKIVLVRMDVNVPMRGSEVRDMTRIDRQLPTLKYLIAQGAKVVILSHFGRPNGQYDPALSLSILLEPLGKALGQEVKFGLDCVGFEAETAISTLQNGEVVMLENLRFHAEEKQNDAKFAKALAALGDAYINDAFSCSHRAHASLVGITEHLPSYAGASLLGELDMLSRIFDVPERPLAAVIGGAKVSTKLSVLHYLTEKVDTLIIGGAMAHTFLAAQGHSLGKSLYEPDLTAEATAIMTKAKAENCQIILPQDMVVSKAFAAHAPNRVSPIHAIADDEMALDVGLESLDAMRRALTQSRSIVWNGPMGAFEHSPFDHGTVTLARQTAMLTASGQLLSVAGGGDTVAALAHSGLFDAFTYLSTAGGAFLEWMEGKTLPGIAALKHS